MGDFTRLENTMKLGGTLDMLRRIRRDGIAASAMMSVDARDLGKEAAKEDGRKMIEHKGKKMPAKVKEYADEIRAKDPSASDEYAYRTAWDRYLSYKRPDYPGRGEAGGFERPPKTPLSEPAKA